MDVEVKLRLPDAEAHRRVTEVLASFHDRTNRQENFFFDGSAGELSASRATLCLRFYDTNQRCVVILKAKAVLVDGVSRVEGDKERLKPPIGRDCVADPGRLKDVESRVLGRVREEFRPLGFVGLEGFENVRRVYKWKGLTLELDETDFGFGTQYEIECESANPEDARQLLEEFLKGNDIPYSYSEKSKFDIFRSGKLP
ncbi:triphosphate tunnel metalloenzyme 3-like [Corylus avellana]|uniref:triphosphate tunnel metalloenzyme 3-like n=1 Tax=Corylus avellana TaxID=13451 RepID=UPI001E2105CB|nr:triphosphate tunnel metalloenzyme 3-like [Corylus avellana]